jgi:ABC-2 type transport system permease protein
MTARAKRRWAAIDLRRMVILVGTLAVAQFRLRYLDGALSYVWAVARPALLFAVLYAVFTGVGDLDRGVDHYAAYLFTSIVIWSFFAESTASALSSLVQHGQILRKLPLAPAVIPFSVVLSSVFDLAMSLVAVLVFMVAAGLEPRLSWLELPLLIGVVSLLVAGIAMLLSVLYVRYRDIDQIWIVLRQVLFYTSPIIYVVATLPESFQSLAMANPLAVVFTQARHALIDPAAPSAAAAAGGYLSLLVPLGIVMAVFCLGAWKFARSSPWLAERL